MMFSNNWRAPVSGQRVAIEYGHRRSADGPGLQDRPAFFHDRDHGFELLTAKGVLFTVATRWLARA